ncbi:MAG: MerR family transcriptional regulator [Myxococcales bacterium]|nr:MerR family transcriptional regulator [Myxococcales bacterium]
MSNNDQTPRHRIGAVARITGISTHALRVWERRYGTTQPQRSGGGDRLYSDQDVQRLRLVKRLLGLGHAIGDVAKLPHDELEKLLALHDDPGTALEHPADRLLERYLADVEKLDLSAAEQTLAGAALALPRREFIDQVLVPLLHEVGSRWQTGSLHVAEEHAASAMVRSQLGAMLRLFAPEQSAPVAVATTLAGELHELGALMSAVVAAMSGWRTLFLGPNLPVSEIVHSARTCTADAVLISCVAIRPAEAAPLLAELSNALPPGTALVVGGHSAQQVTELPSQVVRVSSLAELEMWLAGRLSPTAGRSSGRGR